MASQHLRAARRANAETRLQDAQKSLIATLELEVEEIEPLTGSATRDVELLGIVRLETAAQIMEAAAEKSQSESANDSAGDSKAAPKKSK